MNDSIFIIDNNGELKELNEANYLSEDMLQSLLADYPKLISGDQIDSDNPRRWILISREMGIADDYGAGNRWALDHLFIDQDGIPTLVEVKRSTDTRIRREVIGQILDYAANAVVYWRIEDVRKLFEEKCKMHGTDHIEVLNEFLEGELDIGDYWDLIDSNLKIGKIRMLIIADIIPNELKRIIEFLNEQLSPAEILGVELKQFVGPDIKTIVPRVIGNTSASQITKSKSKKISIERTEESYLSEFLEYNGQDKTKVFERILQWAKDSGFGIWYGKGQIGNGSMVPYLEKIIDGKTDSYIPFSVFVYGGGTIEIDFQYIKNKKPFDNEGKRIELLNKINQITSVAIPVEKIAKRPSIKIDSILEDKEFEKFISAFAWFVNEFETL